MIFSCLMLGQPWLTLGPLLLLVRHSGITSLFLFAHLFSLLPFPRLSLASSLTFSWNRNALKALLFGLHREKRYINIYIQYNTMMHRFLEGTLFKCFITLCKCVVNM